MSITGLDAVTIAARIAQGSLRAADVAGALLDQVAARDPVVRAFAAIDPDAVLRAARALDAGPRRGALHGVPIAVKDVLDTADLPTAMGSAIFAGHQPRADAACVALARAAGALVLGKTVTAEFAYVEPGPTTNPHHPGHTPGGSSSGSAAAVAAGMVPIAIGTQTGGSVLRPAAFCGVVGFKPSFGLIHRGGLKLMAESLDTIGLFARGVADVALALPVLAGLPALATAMPRPPRIGVCRVHPWALAAPEARAVVEEAAARLAEAGAEVQAVTLPPAFDALLEVRRTINDFEIGRALAWEYHAERPRLSPRLAAAIEAGRATPFADYAAAQAAATAARAAFPAAMAGCDALLVPGAQGEAPAGLASTGDSRFQGLWTLLHGPSLGLPVRRGPPGLPLGIQLVAPAGRDAALLACGAWAEAALQPLSAASR
ncbi:amidase [Falsiroseomonas ponticola]|uniref:amidase n=1 Tax=Falsiroseomonas ponticola TaxID=2786951 RepID=UPI0019327842|nr:amidase [Roseomonas ponticola]